VARRILVTESRRERALRTLAHLYAVDLGIAGDHDACEEVTVDYLFAEVWNRPALDP
jgi:hypothetical protein